jgi:alkylhydroperoxidase family enzyme
VTVDVGQGWLPSVADGPLPIDRVLGLRPDLYAEVRTWYGHVWDPPVCDPVLLELVRLRVAQLHGCREQQAVRYALPRERGLTDERAAAVARWATEPSFGAAERAALAFAELFVIDVHAVTDEDVDALRRHLTDVEIVGLCNALAVWDGFMRLRVLLGADEPPEGASFEAPVLVPTPTASSPSMA